MDIKLASPESAPGTIVLNGVIQGIHPLLQRSLGDDILIELVLGPEDSMEGEAQQIEQILLNLALNARAAMPAGGRIRIRTDRVLLPEINPAMDEWLTPGEYLRVEFSDSGVGIASDIIGHIFEPFFTTKTEKSAAGLGLSIVADIVHQYHGRIEAESELGKGACFRIFWPRVQETRRITTGDLPESSEEGAESILVVEDEDILRRLVSQLLRRRGYRVIEAHNGKEALEVTDQNPSFDLVITDAIMPEMNGGQFLQRLREKSPETAAMMISGYPRADLTAQGLLQENTPFIEKPRLQQELIHTVRQILDNRHPSAPAA